MDCNLYHIECVCFLYMDIGLDASSSSRMFYFEWNSPKGVARGSWGARDPPFCKPFLTKQPTTCGENAMTISWPQ